LRDSRTGPTWECFSIGVQGDHHRPYRPAGTPDGEPHFDRDGRYPLTNSSTLPLRRTPPSMSFTRPKTDPGLWCFPITEPGGRLPATWPRPRTISFPPGKTASGGGHQGQGLHPGSGWDDSPPASVGSLFPLTGEGEEGYRILTPSGNKKKNASGKKALIPKALAVMKPYKMTPSNIARLGNELLHKPYGWGGISGNRDCSATVKDLFAPSASGYPGLPRPGFPRHFHQPGVSPRRREGKIHIERWNPLLDSDPD